MQKIGVATKAWGFWDNFLWTSDASIDREGKVLRIRKGWGNNSTSFKIEGWAARYGLSLEFLLSLHLGTMAPDLVNAVLQNFDIEVQVYLQESGEAEVAAVYVEPDADREEKTPDKGLTLQDLADTIEAMGGVVSSLQSATLNDDTFTDWVNGISITKKNALYLLKETSLESPANCTGAAQAYIIESSTYETSSLLWGLIDTSSNALEAYGIEKDVDNEVYSIVNTYQNYEFSKDNGDKTSFSAEHCTQSIGTEEKFKRKDFKWLGATEFGYSSDAELENEIVEEEFKDVIPDPNILGKTRIYRIEKVYQRKTWYAIAGEEGEEEEVEYEWISFKYLIYEVGKYDEDINWLEFKKDKEYDYYDEEIWVDTVMFEYIIREKNTAELIDDEILDENGNYNGVLEHVCSKDDELEAGKDKCCKNCLTYVEEVVDALANVQDRDYETYTPYIARVVGSWFRDTYFVIPKEPDVAIKHYVLGLDDYMPIEGSGDLDNDGVVTEDEAENTKYREVYLPGHHDSSLYDAYYTESGENELELVMVDQEYLAESGEYWTKYEVDSNGDYILYYLRPDGKFEPVDGDGDGVQDIDSSGNPIYLTADKFIKANGYESQEEAEADGHAFVKKANTRSATSLETASTGEDDEILWMAYGFDTNGSETGWQKIIREDGNSDVNDVYDIKEPDDESGFFYNVSTTNTVTQIEDAQRAQTNVTIKNLFKYRKYYIYDGTEKRAQEIELDKLAVLEQTVKMLQEEVYPEENWASAAAKDLGKYGRSALRQAYGLTFIADYEYTEEYPSDWVSESIRDEIGELINPDVLSNSKANEVAEQWLEWQLDMFYAVKDGKGANPYRDKGLLHIDSDPRNENLISTVNIDKSSLNAFAILENTRTLDAEYQYRDFKELVVELDYFDKEDLSEELESVFTWVLPEVESAGWPVRPWDKQNIDYGALIQSTATYEALDKLEAEENSETEEDGDTEVPDDTNTDLDNGNNEPSDNTEDTSDDSNTTIRETKIYYIGDSWFSGLKDYAKSTKFSAEASTNASDFMGEKYPDSIPDDTCAIAIHFGLNGTSKYTETQNLIKKLQNDYPDIPIYVLKVSHVAVNYKSGSITASELNTQIDEYNKKMQEFCETAENVNYINPTKNICEDSGSGYLKEDYKMGGGTNDGEFHLNEGGYKQWYKDIISEMKNASGDSRSSSSRELAVFEGYSADNYVVSPVTGKVLEYGTHTRKDVYSGEDEEVEYIVIEVLSEEYFNEDMVADNSQDTEDVDAESAAKGLNLFYSEYEDCCAGYTVMIDGIDVDLSIQDEDGKNGAYEENEVMALYNKSEEDKRKAQEEAKLNAPFFIKYNESGELGDSSSFPETYKASTDSSGYYIKEGKYIGKTIESEDTTDGSSEETVDDEQTSEPYDVVDAGPGDYMRILVKDLDYSIVDDVEEFFDIADYLYGEGGSSQAFNAFNAEVTEEELEMLAAVLVAEHGSSADAMTAVCQVIKNRGNDTVHFTNVSTIADILTASNQYGCVFPVGDNNDSGHQGGYGTAPNGSYTRVYDLGEYGKFVVGNQNGSGPFNERLATDESKSIVEGVLSGSIADEASAQMGKLALYQVTLKDYSSHDSCCVIIGELYAHNWGCLEGNHQSCDCTLP